MTLFSVRSCSHVHGSFLALSKRRKKEIEIETETDRERDGRMRVCATERDRQTGGKNSLTTYRHIDTHK